MNYCEYCGKKIESTGGHCHTCVKSPMNSTGNSMRGWQCPVCKKVFSPYVAECNNCQPVINLELATGTLDEAFINSP